MSISRISLYTGGSRSGKSRAAVDKAQAINAPACFIATCDPQDDEMKKRVQRHREERPESWLLIEEPLDIATQIAKLDSTQYPLVIVDCLTLWISNLMFAETSPLSDESQATRYAQDLVKVARHYSGHVIIVTNEVGSGIIPENELARRFVDLAGRCNQAIAAEADDLILFTCGLPLCVKGKL